MPSDDIRLQVGDRLVVLSTIRGIRRIEQGRQANRQWQIEIIQAVSPDAAFDGATEISRISGCDIGTARHLLQTLPVVLPQKLHRHQALRLVRELTRSRVTARVRAPSDTRCP